MKTRLRVLNLILAIFLFVFAVGNVFAWFSALDKDLFLGGASAGAYFKGGKGTQEEPYTLGNYRHLYNLAWLQNTGRIPDGTYFALDPDEHGTLTMKDESGKSVIVPPIGNADNPFNSYFDGKGMIISGLVVSTNKDVLYGNAASDSYTFSNSVGMFGMTGEDSEIKNFILDNPTVEVAETSKYAEASDSDPASIGLAIGYINGKASSIGVIGGTLAVHKTGYSTLNSILGNMSDDIKNNQNVTGGGTLGTGGSGSAFGASFDVEGMLERLKKIHVGKYGVEYTDDKTLKPSPDASIFLPDIDHSNDAPVPESYEKVPFTVDATQSTYSGSTAREIIANNNIGYVVGNQNKTQVKAIKFTDKLIHSAGENPPSDTHENWTLPDGTLPNKIEQTPQWLYTNDNKVTTGGNAYSPATGFRPLTESEFAALPQGIKDLISGEDTSFETLRLQAQYYKTNDPTVVTQLNNDGKWQYYGQIEWNGKTYMQGFRAADGYAVDETGKRLIDPDTNGERDYQYYTGGVFLKKDCIWFKPSQTGKVRFVLYAGFNGGDATFQLMKVTRTKATAENPFYTKDYSDISLQVIMAHNIASKYCLMYYEYEVTKEDLQPGVEFFISGFNANGANFIYMDIGSSAESDKSDTDHADPLKAVSAIDFIYGGVTITQKDISTDNDTVIPAGSFVIENALYKETGTMISLGGNGALVYYYHRNENGDVFSVGYYGEAPVGSVDGKHTPVSGRSDVVIDKNYSPSVWVPS